MNYSNLFNFIKSLLSRLFPDPCNTMDAFSHLGKQFESDLESDLESVTSDVIYQGRRLPPNNRPRRDSLKTEDDDDVNSVVVPRVAVNGAVSNMPILPFEDDFDESDLPEHACAYCGIHNPACVVKCVTCNKWFCNARGNTTSSHIVTHLVRSRHKVVSLHPDSELGDTVLECYNCGNKNVFLLGFISAKAETVVVILCRHPCASNASAHGVNWDTEQWQPLIEDRMFLNWLVSVPSEKEQLLSRHLTPSQLAKLEEMWRIDANARISDLNKAEAQEIEVAPVALRYDDAYQYQRTFSPLVKIEAEYEKKLRESQSQGDISVTWDRGLSNRYLVSFYLSKFDIADLKVSVGDELRIRYDGPLKEPWVGSGYAIKIPDGLSDEVTIELKSNPKATPPTHLTTEFSVELVWSQVTYDRIQTALKKFATEETSVSGYIYHKLLGHEVEDHRLEVPVPRNLSVPGLAELNSSQRNAVKSVLQKPLSLIQGPPGTGKTVVSTTIVYQLVKTTKEPVLVCAPSNVAVDQLAERLERTGLNVVRMTAKTREHMESRVDHLTLHKKVIQDKSNAELLKLMELKEELGELKAADEKKYFMLLKQAEKRVLSKAEVVCCTCSGAGDKRLANARFRTTLIDESTQATEPECLIPIVHGCKQVILVGDHQQLGPVISNRKAVKAGLPQSLFERLIVLGHEPILLTTQYRMHPCLSLFPSNMFYDGSLQNGVTAEDRARPQVDFPWPVPDNPMMFWCNLGQEEISASGTSYLNRSEAVNCTRVVTKFFKAGIQPSQIGIVTPYEGQRTHIIQHMITSGEMNKDLYKEVEVESVDAFQGREKDYIILSCVRSNEHQGIGFLSDPRRLNVAITRAKYGIVLLGNPRVLCKNLLWCYMLNHFREKGALVEGTLNNLQQCMIPIPKPRQAFRSRARLTATRFGREFSNNERPFDISSVDQSSVIPSATASVYGDVPAPVINPNVLFSESYNVAGITDWPDLGAGKNDARMVASNMSGRVQEFLKSMEDDRDSIDDELQSISSSLATQVGLY